MSETSLTLDELKPGQSATVIEVKAGGLDRRRLMDFGILPGTRIEIELRSPLGSPTAYRVRGSVIALRTSQAQQITIEVNNHDDAR